MKKILIGIAEFFYRVTGTTHALQAELDSKNAAIADAKQHIEDLHALEAEANDSREAANKITRRGLVELIDELKWAINDFSKQKPDEYTLNMERLRQESDKFVALLEGEYSQERRELYHEKTKVMRELFKRMETKHRYEYNYELKMGTMIDRARQMWKTIAEDAAKLAVKPQPREWEPEKLEMIHPQPLNMLRLPLTA